MTAEKPSTIPLGGADSLKPNLKVEADEILHQFMQHSPVYVFLKEVTESASRVLLASENFVDLVGIPGSQMVGKTMNELFPSELAAKMTRDDWEVVSGNQVLTLEEHLEDRHFTTIKFPIAQGGKNLLAGYTIDITERKRHEDRIKALLDEKEAILKEVHHRMKNNMHAIQSLLKIQANTVTEAAGRAALLEAASRVQSMMLLYESLLQSPDYLSMPTRSFLTSLADAAVASFSDNVSVTMDKSIDDCLLSVGKIQPLGIILNELLTNVMKYAFVGKSSGKVIVTFHVSESRGMLVVQDDGLGLPSSIDLDNTQGFGLKLIRLLAKQMGGNLRTERGNGTKMIVEFDN